MNAVFSDQATVRSSNDVVANFVPHKIRGIVSDPVLAERFCPQYPIGTRRLALDSSYYETYNRTNVTLVDIGADPIAKVTRPAYGQNSPTMNWTS